MTHSLYVKLSKNSKDYGEPDITYKLVGCAEQRPLGPWDACLSKNHDGTTQQIDDAVGNFETENQVFLQKTCFITEVV